VFAYAIGGDITSAGLYDSALYLTVGQSGWFNLNTRIQITIGLILESHIFYVQVHHLQAFAQPTGYSLMLLLMMHGLFLRFHSLDLSLSQAIAQHLGNRWCLLFVCGLIIRFHDARLFIH